MKVLYEEDRKAAFMNIVALIHLLCRFIFWNPNIILVKKVAAYKTQAKFMFLLLQAAVPLHVYSISRKLLLLIDAHFPRCGRESEGNSSHK